MKTGSRLVLPLLALALGLVRSAVAAEVHQATGFKVVNVTSTSAEVWTRVTLRAAATQPAPKSFSALTNNPAGIVGAPSTGPAAPPALPAAALLPGQTNAASSLAGTTNSSADQPLPEGMIDFRGADLNQVLEIYSMLVNRTLLRLSTLAGTIVLKTQGQLTIREGIQALEAVLALNGITMVAVGEKFVKVVGEAQSGSAAAAFNTNSAGQLPDLGQYVTHVVQLKYAKPSELVPVLTPFAKIPNAIVPLEANQILILRDYAENVKRMLEMVNKIDVALPSEFVEEVIPIKYAKASEIAGALNSLGSGGGGATVGGGGGQHRGRCPRQPRHEHSVKQHGAKQ